MCFFDKKCVNKNDRLKWKIYTFHSRKLIHVVMHDVIYYNTINYTVYNLLCTHYFLIIILIRYLPTVINQSYRNMYYYLLTPCSKR